MNNLPVIRIQKSPLLEKRFGISPLAENTVKTLRKSWKRHEKQILSELQNITGLTFAQDRIDAYVVDPKAFGGMSDPLIIGGATGPKRFIFLLAHELTHRLIFDNTSKVDWHKKAWKIWPKEPHLVAHHVVVHSILQVLFTRIKNPVALKLDKEISKRFPSYQRAWEIVQKEGAHKVIKKVQR